MIVFEVKENLNSHKMVICIASIDIIPRVKCSTVLKKMFIVIII